MGGILGGILLVLAPDGHIMKIPVSVMHGAFPDFLIPGLILTGMGLLTTTACITVLFRTKLAWLMSGLALIGFTIWFAVEIAILRELHIFHIIWGVPILIGYWCALPLFQNNTKQ